MNLYRINNGSIGVCTICVIAKNEKRARVIAEKFFKEDAAKNYVDDERYWKKLNIYLESDDTTEESIVVIPE